MKVSPAIALLLLVTADSQVRDPPAPASSPPPKRITLAVLPFLAAGAKEQALAEKLRFAVSQKLSNDADLGQGPGQSFDRLDNVKIDDTISALGIPWAAGGPKGPGTLPADDDLQELLGALDADQVIAGVVQSRKLTLTLYTAGKAAKTASVEIPSDRESPKLAIEKILTDLTGARFGHIRQVEADHSDPAAEKRFAARPNLVTDPSFEDAAKGKAQAATSWDTILGPDHYAPPLLAAGAARDLAEDRAAIVPRSLADPSAPAAEHCLMMRMSKQIAESNGLACVSTWIPVEAGKKYRFTCRYKSEGPTARLFLKGFAYKPDAYGDKNDPEAVRREYYRAQVAPREKNRAFEPIEMDFTPSALQPTDPKIQWMRVDLYIYLHPGTVYFDDVTMKKLDP